MKKVFFFMALICLSNFMMSQNSITKNDTINYKNEIGLDATSFIKQFINFNSDLYQSYYVPNYYLTYRFRINKSNIRAAFGGSFQDYNRSSYSSQIGRNKSISKSIDFRIGYELTHQISKRWLVFYGLDCRPSFEYTKNDANYYNGGYATGSKSESKIIGFAPLLGFKFKLNDRLSLSTEASISLNYSETKSRNYYTPQTNQYPPIPDDNIRDNYDWYTSFNQPVFLILSFVF